MTWVSAYVAHVYSDSRDLQTDAPLDLLESVAGGPQRCGASSLVYIATRVSRSQAEEIAAKETVGTADRDIQAP